MKKVLKSFDFALEGILEFFLYERNARIQLVVAIVASILGVLFKISQSEWLMIIFSIALILSLEMINSAIEKLCDLVTKDFHPGIKRIKDISAGAVLLASVLSLIAGLIIFIPKIVQLLNQSK
jgi:diacylglycerol kinase